MLQKQAVCEKVGVIMIEKILERLEAERHPEIFGGWETMRIDRAKEIVQEVAKEYGEQPVVKEILTSEKDSGWIPVEIELPKEHGKYIVTVENLTGRDILPEKVFECAYMYGQFIFNGSFDNRVTAWRKKPAPYQKGE